MQAAALRRAVSARVYRRRRRRCIYMHKTCEAVIFAPRNWIEIPEKLGYTEHNRGVSENGKAAGSERSLRGAGCFSAEMPAAFQGKMARRGAKGPLSGASGVFRYTQGNTARRIAYAGLCNKRNRLAEKGAFAATRTGAGASQSQHHGAAAFRRYSLSLRRTAGA